MRASKISARQLAANRANAQKSTGPTSRRGKDICRRNASRHHLTGQVSTMTDEDRAAYDIHLDGFIADLKPQGDLEMTLVHSVAYGFWRLHRAEAIEENQLALEAKRNEHTIECINGQVTAAILQARAFFENVETFVLLTLYEQRIHSKTHKDYKILRERQASRPRTQQSARPAAQPIPQPKAKSASCGENGSVFSNTLQPPPDPAPTAKIVPDAPDLPPEIPKEP
jgi:hypothetical protein